MILANCNRQRGEQTYGRGISPLSQGLGEGVIVAELPGFLRSEQVPSTEERGKELSEDGKGQSHGRGSVLDTRLQIKRNKTLNWGGGTFEDATKHHVPDNRLHRIGKNIGFRESNNLNDLWIRY